MSKEDITDLISKLKLSLERGPLHVPSEYNVDFGFQIEKGEESSTVLFEDHKKNLNVDMCWQSPQRSRPPMQRIDGLYGTSLDPYTEHPIVTIELIGSQSLKIEPLAKKLEAHVSGPKDAKLHLRSIFWDHESDGHTNQLMNPVVLEDYLSREFRIISAIDKPVHPIFRSLQIDDLPLLESAPLINQYQSLVDKEYIEMVDPELADAANSKNGDYLLEAAKESRQHREAIEILVKLAEKFDWLKPLSPVITYYIFFVGGSYGDILRFLKSHESELRKDPSREVLLEFLSDEYILILARGKTSSGMGINPILLLLETPLNIRRKTRNSIIRIFLENRSTIIFELVEPWG